MSPTLVPKKIHLYPVKKEKSEDNLGFFGENSTNDWFSGEAQLSCDVYEDSDNLMVKSTVAGVKPENLEISISNDLLTIRGFREQEDQVSDDNYYCRECYWGAFSRSIVLPREVDQKRVDAMIKNGVLTIKLPKKYKTSSIKVKQLND
jgi:HSP20 family protein